MRWLFAAVTVIGIFLLQETAGASDLRVVSRKAQAAYEAAQAHARAAQERILQDRGALAKAVADAKNRRDALQARLTGLREEQSKLEDQEAEMVAKAAGAKTDLAGYAGVVRQTARDLKMVLAHSHFTAGNPHRTDVLDEVAGPDHFPGLETVANLADLFFGEMIMTGGVDRFEGDFIDINGMPGAGRLLTIGPFTAVYDDGNQVGFLRYSEASRQFKALASPPSFLMRRNLKAYMEGDAEAVFVDLSGGTALGRVAHRTGFLDKLRQGGFLIWPILALGLVSLILTCERLIFLNRVHANTDRLMGRVNELAGQGQWNCCHDIIAGEKDRPVRNVLKAGLGAMNEARETLENILQEAILKELPRLERFLPALNVMAAVAPLLGLLGTVTGMIGTFQVITLYGTGDPRLMAGGISEALVTTMVGLAVAIPVMLIHTFLKRQVEHIVGDMEEKALALSNIICRECNLKNTATSLPAGVFP